MPTDDEGRVALVTVDDDMTTDTGHINVDKVYQSPTANGYLEGYLTGDGIPANGETYVAATTFPNNPVEGMFVLRTDYSPNRLFRYDGRRFVKIEDNVRQTMTQTNTRNTQKTGFINNTNTTTLADGSSTTKERVALSKLLKPQADN
jgi:hypothetical protein